MCKQFRAIITGVAQQVFLIVGSFQRETGGVGILRYAVGRVLQVSMCGPSPSKIHGFSNLEGTLNPPPTSIFRLEVRFLAPEDGPQKRPPRAHGYGWVGGWVGGETPYKNVGTPF